MLLVLYKINIVGDGIIGNNESSAKCRISEKDEEFLSVVSQI